MLKRLCDKYKKIPITVKASFWFLVCGFIQRGISLITTPVFSRLLSTGEYGDFSVYNSWYNIIIIFASLNLASGVYMRGLVKYEEDKDRFTGSLQCLYILTTAICFSIYMAFQKQWDTLFGLDSSFIYAMFVDILAATAYHFWSTQQRVDFQYRKLVIVTMINAVLRPGAGIVMIYMFPLHKLEARIFSMVVVDAITFGPFFFGIFRKGIKVFTTRYWKYALAFNLPLVPHYLSQIVLNQSDRIMIKSMEGSSVAGIYSLAYSVASIMTIVNTSVINTLTPWMYKKMKAKEYKQIGTNTILLLVLIGFANFALVVFAPEAVAIMAPASYYDAIWVIPPVAASTFFTFMYSLFSRFEFYFEKTQFMMIASMLGASLNLLLNYIFIPIYGYYAAGYTTLFCYIFYCLGHYLLMRRINNQLMDHVKVYNTKLIICISLTFMMLCGITMCLYKYFVLRLLLFVFVCGFFIWKQKEFINLFKMLKAEKNKDKTEKNQAGN